MPIHDLAVTKTLSEPMRILQIAYRPGSGGPGIYVPNLVRDLVSSGNEVAVFFPGEYDFSFKTRLEKRSSEGICYYSLVNSPNYHTGILPIHPAYDVSQPKIETAFQHVLKDFRPDVVHFHDLGGLCISLMRIAAEAKIPFFNSLHSYALVCHQNHLLNQQTKSICKGPGDGRRCVLCMGWTPALQRNLPLAYFAERARGAWNKRVASFLKVPPIPYLSVRKVGPEVSPEDLPIDELARDYAARTAEAVEIMSTVPLLNFAVSEGVRRIYESFGVKAEKLLVQHIGSRAAERFRPLPMRQSDSLVIGYIGAISFHKGVHVLIDAFNRLDPGDSAQLHLYGYQDVDFSGKIKDGLVSDKVKFFGAYSHADLEKIMGSLDVVVVPPVWEDNAPQTVFEALACGRPVIGAAIGGIPDFVEHGRNGLLFRAGDSEDLAAQLRRVMNREELLTLAKGISPMKTMAEHAAELTGFYKAATQKT
jgi:glycosyltransferase involved in cell wall biosynthesis